MATWPHGREWRSACYRRHSARQLVSCRAADEDSASVVTAIELSRKERVYFRFVFSYYCSPSHQ